MRKRKNDRRLLGMWKSDRRRTFEHFVPRPDATPDAVRKLRALFGKLVVRWTRTMCYSQFDGHESSDPYEVVASDSKSVVIRSVDSLSNENRLTQIHFEGRHYWICLGGMREFFKRIET
jgi:hypothetical protein